MEPTPLLVAVAPDALPGAPRLDEAALGVPLRHAVGADAVRAAFRLSDGAAPPPDACLLTHADEALLDALLGPDGVVRIPTACPHDGPLPPAFVRAGVLGVAPADLAAAPWAATLAAAHERQEVARAAAAARLGRAARLSDPERLRALAEADLMDTAPEPSFDRVTALVQRVLGVPIALVSLVSDKRQFFKSRQAPPALDGVTGTPLSHSFCQDVVASEAPLRIDDAVGHPLVCDNGAIADLGVAAYLGAPVRAENGAVLGSLCAIDTVPHAWTDADLATLVDLAAVVSDALAARAADRRRQADLRAANAELELLNAALEARVAERTAELADANAALEAHVRELERSNRELDQFSYVASHDLKAPLRAIDNLAAWIAEDAADALPPDSRRHLGTLRSRVSRMERLLDDLLAYSRAGRKLGEPERVDVAELLADVEAMVAPPDGFRIATRGPLPTLTTYRFPLTVVLRNLVANAAKHHPDPAQGRVTVTAEADGDVVTFTVADDGDGIAPEYHERIFGLFQTLRPRDEVEGSGVGLAVVRKAVEGLGGTVAVESDRGRGAAFRFTWPAYARADGRLGFRDGARDSVRDGVREGAEVG